MRISDMIARMNKEIKEGGDRDVLFAWWDKNDFAPELSTEQWENVVSRVEDDADYSDVNDLIATYSQEELNS